MARTFTAQVIPLSHGVAGTQRTLSVMAAITRAARHDPFILQTARSIVRGTPARDTAAEVAAIGRYVRTHIRYTKDPVDVESVSPPAWTLGARAGDCDDQAILVASLLRAVGIPARFVAVGPAKSHYVHVFPEARVGTAWVPIDTALPPGAPRAPYTGLHRLVQPIGGRAESGLGKGNPFSSIGHFVTHVAHEVVHYAPAIITGGTALLTHNPAAASGALTLAQNEAAPTVPQSTSPVYTTAPTSTGTTAVAPIPSTMYAHTPQGYYPSGYVPVAASATSSSSTFMKYLPWIVGGVAALGLVFLVARPARR